MLPIAIKMDRLLWFYDEASISSQAIHACIGYLAHPFKKDRLGLLDHSYPLTRNPIEGQGNRFFSLDGERSSFDGFWAYDDDPLGRIDSLMKGRLRSLLFKPPFDTHGADRLRSE